MMSEILKVRAFILLALALILILGFFIFSTAAYWELHFIIKSCNEDFGIGNWTFTEDKDVISCRYFNSSSFVTSTFNSICTKNGEVVDCKWKDLIVRITWNFWMPKYLRMFPSSVILTFMMTTLLDCSRYIICYKDDATSNTLDIIFLFGTSLVFMILMYLLDRHTTKLAKTNEKEYEKFYGKE